MVVCRGGQLANVAAKDRERLPTVLFVPITVEEREAFVWRGVGHFPNMVDDLGCEEGLASTSYVGQAQVIDLQEERETKKTLTRALKPQGSRLAAILPIVKLFTLQQPFACMSGSLSRNSVVACSVR